jgi:hypothetical protein
VGLRRATRRPRSLPDFLVIGAQRSGTTSLYRYLSAHPDIAPSLGKELQFFSLEYGRGEGWYRAHFPSDARRRRHQARRQRHLLSFEATPYYLFHPLAPERAAHHLSQAKLIAVLRDPVERAYSHFKHSKGRGVEPLDFEAALAAEDGRLAADPEHRSRASRIWSYASRGLYDLQLERWLRHFPREQLLVLRSEDLYEHTADTYAEVLAFLDAADVRLTDRAAYAGTPPADPLPADLRRRLEERFRPHNERLATLLGWEEVPW